MKSLLILGAGQLGAICKDIAEDIGTYDKIGFLDDRDFDCLGRLDDLEEFKEQFTDAIVCINDLFIRRDYTQRLRNAGYHVPVIVHPRAFVSTTVTLGAGTVVFPLASIMTGARVGQSCFVCTCAVIDHNATIGDYCIISSNSTVLQNSYMSSGTATNSGQMYFAEPAREQKSGGWTAARKVLNTNILKHKRFLLADDVAINRQMAAEIIGEYESRVDCVSSGEEALEAVVSRGQRYYDYILMDLNMPGMDGLEATRQIRAHGFYDVPVIAVTAYDREQMEREAFDSGLNGFIRKPFSIAELLNVLSELDKRR